MNIQDRSQLFIDKATKTHGGMYDYSMVNYVNSSSKVTILCRRCGKKFDQAPMSHTSSSNPCGCPHCRYERRQQPKPHTTLTTDAFIAKAIDIHGSTYNYDSVEYTNSRTKVTIMCPTHGEFTQRPNTHLAGGGCCKCEYENKSKRNKQRALSTEDFVARCISLYGDRYDYSDTVYESGSTPIQIRCTTHGVFVVARAEKHLTGQECRSCSKHEGSLGERKIAQWLTTHNIRFEREKIFDACRSPITGRKLKYDFFLPEHNTIIEFDGIQHVEAVPFFNKKYSLTKCQAHDLVKTEFAHLSGYIMIRLTSQTVGDIGGIVDAADLRV